MILLETVKRQTTFDNEEEDIKVEELSDYSIIQGVFSTGPSLKGGPVQNQVKVPRLVLPWSSPKS